MGVMWLLKLVRLGVLHLSQLLNCLNHKFHQLEMKAEKTNLIFIVLLAISLTTSHSADPDPVLFDVSTSLSEWQKPQGSLMGGTQLYIRGANFGDDPSQVNVFVGPYPCPLLADGLKSEQISCRTTQCTDLSKQYNLGVTVFITGKEPVTCKSSSCAFSYKKTPYVRTIFPNSAPGNTKLSINGIHKIENLGDGRTETISDIRYFLVGDSVCSTLDIDQQTDNWNSEQWRNLYCNTFLNQRPGEYFFTQLVKPGYAQLSSTLAQTSAITGQPYIQRVLPKIKTMSTHKGGAFGGRLRVCGTGFSSDLADYECTVAGETCTVVSANENSALIEVPKISEANEGLGKLAQEITDSSEQHLPYLGVQGARYTRFSRNRFYKPEMEDWLQAVRDNSHTMEVVEEKMVTELRSVNENGEDHVEYIRGYFHAPKNGTYRFSIAADDRAIMKLSTVSGNANPSTMNTILEQTRYNPDLNPYLFPESSGHQTFSDVTLKEGGEYYFEILIVNFRGVGFYNVMVEVPRVFTEQPTANPTWAIDEVVIRPAVVDPEILQLTVFAASGSYQLFYKEGSNTKIATFSIGDSAEQFLSKLKRLPNIINYNATVDREELSESGQVITDGSPAAGWNYYISIYKFRSQDTWMPYTIQSELVAGSVPVSLTIQRIKNHSAPLRGSYALSINGTRQTLNNDDTSDLPFDLRFWRIDDIFRSYYKASDINVRYKIGNDFDEEVRFQIQYVGVNRQPYSIALDLSLITGGRIGTTPVSEVKSIRTYSQRPLYYFVPFEFLHTGSELPSLQLSINRMPAICSNCLYEVDDSQVVTATSYSINEGVVTINTVQSGRRLLQATEISLDDVTVSLLGVECISITGTIESFNCVLPTNQDGSLALPAGTDYFKMHIEGTGFVDVESMGQITVDLVVNTMNPSAGSPAGGSHITISGSGFPINGVDPTLSISLCGNTVTEFLSVENQQITLIAPAQVSSCTGGGVSQIQYGGQTVALSFAYDSSIAPTITSLSRSNASPVLKTQLTITGSQFGTQSTTKVFLKKDGAIKYELSIVSFSGNQISCILGGGRVGDYDLAVVSSITGASLINAQSAFSYKIAVSSLSVSLAPLGGGIDLIITGYNFASSFKSTNVMIGTAVNNFCSIKALTDTQITCTLPQIHSSFTPGSPVEVKVLGRMTEESVCEGTCTLSYDNSISALIDPLLTTTYLAAETVSISGTNLLGASVEIGGIVCEIISNTATLIEAKYPSLTAGTYDLLVKVGSQNSYPLSLQTETKFVVQGKRDNNQVSILGRHMTVYGNGFPGVEGWLIYLSCPSQALDIYPEIISATASEVVVVVPPTSVAGDEDCFIRFKANGSTKKYAVFYRAIKAMTANLEVSSNPFEYTITKTLYTAIQFSRIHFVPVDANDSPLPYRIQMDFVEDPVSRIVTVTAPQGSLPLGKYLVRAEIAYGFAQLSNPYVEVAWADDEVSAPVIDSSYFGGAIHEISGHIYDRENKGRNSVSVCGIPATIVSISSAALTYETPQILNEFTQSLYQFNSVTDISGEFIGDSDNLENAFDSSLSTVYKSQNAECWIGYDFGENFKADIYGVRYAPDPSEPVPSSKLEGALFQVSNDNANWVTLFEVDISDVHPGYNQWNKATGESFKYRYLRFRHTSISECFLAEIQVSGIKYSTISIPESGCDVTVSVDHNQHILPAKVMYSQSATPVITGVSPQFGSSTGGDTLTISGTNFGSSPSVMIDQVECVVQSSSETTITCVTGLRSVLISENSFQIHFESSKAYLMTDPFTYVDLWSAANTWGGEAPPREGDTVYVPKGMTLLVDQSTPLLSTIIVEGKIKFADTQDLTVDVHYFIINGGEFEAGTETNPYQHNLLITLHGDYSDKQLPIFGNKVLGCRNCKFNMHGRVRTPTWTLVSATIEPGMTTFSVLQPVDWMAGEKVAVAATGFDHYETEERTIATVSADKMTITVTEAFNFRHFSAVENYGGVEFPMRAEVGLLTRNIRIQGDSNSDNTAYGSHLMLNGQERDGLIGKLSYTEFTQCGQPRIVGRYCTHFHMAGEVPNSYIRGIAVHHSHARVLTIHGTHFLLVEKNVGYHVKGHNIFIEDGIETNNIIQDNLMMSSISSSTLLQSDTSVSSYWITNPYNTVRRNHAAGGEFYGFWYEIKQNPTGPSATQAVCPMGMKLGISQDNVAHSNIRFGIRIFRHSARKYPCLPTKQENDEDPYTANPPSHSLYRNYTLWKNKESGLLAEEVGFTTVDSFKTADNGRGGLQFHETNMTKELVIAQNSIIVGFSEGNSENVDETYKNARGLIAPRTDGFKASNISFYNFGRTMTPLQSCSGCETEKGWVNGAATTEFEKIAYSNIIGNYIFWEKHRREIFSDLDGSLTKPMKDLLTVNLPDQTRASVTPNIPSISQNENCHLLPQERAAKWDNAVFCGESVTLRKSVFADVRPLTNFQYIELKVKLLSDPLESLEEAAESDFSSVDMVQKAGDIQFAWKTPLAMGKYYNVHWRMGLDFEHLMLGSSRLWEESDGVVLRFNYSETREYFKIGRYFQNSLQLPLIDSQDALIDPSTCNNGDSYHDAANRLLFVCVSGRGKTIEESVDISAIRCESTCADAGEIENPRENFLRYWSDASNWPDNGLPTEGSNVTIPYEWDLVMDVNPPKLNYLEVNGILSFVDSRDNILEANYIWVKKGKISIGTQAQPFVNKAEIILHGGKDDKRLVMDPATSLNKMLAVSGALEFYGNPPSASWTKLTAIAAAGSNVISVGSMEGWKVGDKLVIAPSYSKTDAFEEVEIVALLDQNTVQIAPQLVYEHYGDEVPTISNDYGVLDTRSAVGHLSRNIKISGADDVDGWGCSVFVFGFTQIFSDFTSQYHNGYAKFNGVQLENCGQFDTQNGGLTLTRLGSSQQASTSTEISNSAVHHCQGFCSFIDDVSDVTLSNNVFFKAIKFIVKVENVVDNYAFTNNLLVGAMQREKTADLPEDTSAYQQYHSILYQKFDTLTIQVSGNLVQGSQGSGFVFPLSPCTYLEDYPFAGNTAGSCEIGFMYNKIARGYSCLGATGARAYATKIGLIANPNTGHNQLKYDNMIFADNKRGITLRYSLDSDDNTALLTNSYFAGYSRPSCPDCYGENAISYCQGGFAVRMLSVTQTGESFPLKSDAKVFDVICTAEAYDMKAFLENVVFENYQYHNEQIPYCSNMRVFRRHDNAADATGSHHLTNTRCVNCDQESWAFFQKPNEGWRGWFGGCGDMDCTGPNNYLIHDHDGQFLGKPSILLANNTEIGDNEPSCTEIPQINGHLCETEELAVLEYESIASDFNTRSVWPVFMMYDNGAWNTSTNGWKEWQWDEDGAMNRRMARFYSVIKLSENYNMTFSASPPTDMRFQIQERYYPRGKTSEWTIVRIKFPIPNMVEVLVNNYAVKPNPIIDGMATDLSTQYQTCGANNFNFDEGIIEFVVNGRNCQVRVKTTSYVQITATFIISLFEFFSNNADTNFLNNICAFLGIDPSNLKIVSANEAHQSGRRLLQDESPAMTMSMIITIGDIDQNGNPYTAEQKIEQLTELRQKLIDGIQNHNFQYSSTPLRSAAGPLQSDIDNTRPLEVYDIETDIVVPDEEGEAQFEKKENFKGTSCPYRYEYNESLGKCTQIERGISELSLALTLMAVILGLILLACGICIVKQAVTRKANPELYAQASLNPIISEVESAKEL